MTRRQSTMKTTPENNIKTVTIKDVSDDTGIDFLTSLLALSQYENERLTQENERKDREFSALNDMLLLVESEREQLANTVAELKQQLDDIKKRYLVMNNDQDFTVVDTLDYFDEKYTKH